jgi:hypothetical protein
MTVSEAPYSVHFPPFFSNLVFTRRSSLVPVLALFSHPLALSRWVLNTGFPQ